MLRRAYEAILPINKNLILLQCTAAYPCPYEMLDLRVIETYRKEFPGAVVGLSSHDNGIAMPVVASHAWGPCHRKTLYSRSRDERHRLRFFARTSGIAQTRSRPQTRSSCIRRWREESIPSEREPLVKMGKSSSPVALCPKGTWSKLRI
jgi:N-acetylneuraminate synthase/sialic acid synthase